MCVWQLKRLNLKVSPSPTSQLQMYVQVHLAVSLVVELNNKATWNESGYVSSNFADPLSLFKWIQLD